MTTVAHDSPAPNGDSHGGHEHPKFLAHHFETPQQQFDSGKLGTWLFLTTEILLFSGLFCAYAVYRANHPEIFAWAHEYLNKWYGAINTIVLIFSSFTMAWAVRAAQTNAKNLCVALCAITIACGGVFMCIKYVEYKNKWEEHLLPGDKYNPTEFANAHGEANSQEQAKPGNVKAMGGKKHAEGEKPAEAAMGAAAAAPVATAGPNVTTMSVPSVTTAPAGYVMEESNVPRAAVGPAGVSTQWQESDSLQRAGRNAPVTEHPERPEPKNTHIFFGIYFLMTGLHGIHVLAGMCLIAWVMIRAAKGEFSAEYFYPVDFVGLYWHIVDLVWIFLFPLLYLIGNNP